ncbi:unnamed protein product [Rotaria sp. Silwood2]|nr:unnamed protein product [Rotaria sp. Silwood2]CAF3319466.1 unnamed protein product [Rotaria sp. Silwood2]CAF3382963.1 unnamed protein product [Rotaria sp. Silwood2]
MDANTETTSIPQYETTVFTLKPDNFGPNRATLLHARTTKKSNLYKAVLYLHGYNDYFFQDHVCNRFLDFGYDFFALDMHKCGRSIISPEQDQYRHYCTDMHEYDEEISLSIEHMNKQAEEYANKKFALIGHSTVDLVLNVENIRRAAGMLGQHVTLCPIEKATHDVFLSKKPVREQAFKCMFQWLENLEREWIKDV